MNVFYIVFLYNLKPNIYIKKIACTIWPTTYTVYCGQPHIHHYDFLSYYHNTFTCKTKSLVITCVYINYVCFYLLCNITSVYKYLLSEKTS